MTKRIDIEAMTLSLLRNNAITGLRDCVITGLRLMRPIGLIALIACMVACSDDSPEHRGEYQLVELIPYYNIYNETEVGTRARDTELFGTSDNDYNAKYKPYTNLVVQSDTAYANIRVFLTSETEIATQGNFTYRDYRNKWTSSVWVEANKDYYVYGFMPATIASNASLTTNGGSYTNKAVLTLNSIDAFTPADVCVVVGVKGLTHATYTDIAESGIKIGEFAYKGQTEETGNYIYLLLNHLYSCLKMEYRVGSNYSKLRTIRLRRVAILLEGQGGKVSKRNITVTIDGANYTVNDVAAGGTALSDTAVIYDKTRSNMGELIPEKITDATLGLPVPGYFTPELNNNNFVIVSTYDIYDKKGNLVRANQIAKNIVTPEDLSIISNQKRGWVYTLRFLIEPTYLYQLSDEDLNNPTVRVE